MQQQPLLSMSLASTVLDAQAPGPQQLAARRLSTDGTAAPYKMLEIRTQGASGDSGVVYRIRYTEASSSEELDRAIRLQMKLKTEDQFCLIDLDEEVVPLGGSMPPGEYLLKTISLNDVDSDADSADEGQTKGRRRSKTHNVGGHMWEAKHFHTVQLCDHCRNPMFGIGKQGYMCKNCGTHLHKRCHTEYPIECGMAPETLPQCANCKKRYKEELNGATACVYHRELVHGWCLRCKQSYRSPGCMVGQHEQKVGKGKKRAKLRKKGSRAQMDDEGPLVGSVQILKETPVDCGCSRHLATELMDRRCALPVDYLCEALFGNDPIIFRHVNNALGHTGLELGEWQELAEGQQRRTVKYFLPLVTMFGGKEVQCTETQTLHWKHGRRTATVQTVVTMADAPYGSSYELGLTHCIMPDTQASARMLVTAEPIFHQWLLLGAMLQGRLEDRFMDYAAALRLELRRAEEAYAKERGLAWEPDPSDMLLAVGYDSGAQRMLRQPLWLLVAVLAVAVALFVASWVMYIRLKEIEAMLGAASAPAESCDP